MGVLVVGVLVAGCSNDSTTGSTSTQTTTQTVTGTSASAPPSGEPSGSAGTGAPPTGSTTTLTVRDADKGRTLTVKVGDPLTLTLTGKDWAFTDPKPPTVLTAMSPPIVAQEQGTSSVSFRAGKAGTAIVTATKANGEAFQITVIVQ